MTPFVRLGAVRFGDRLCAQSVLLIVLGILTLTFSGLPESRQDELDYQTTRSLANMKAGDLEGTPEAERLVQNEESLWQPEPGRLRSTRPLGGPIAAVPLYWLGSLFQTVAGDLERRHAESEPLRRSEYCAHLLVGWKSALLASITAWLLVLSSRRIGVDRRHAWLAGLVFVMTTFVWPQARGSSVDVQAAFFLFLAFHLLLRSRERFERLRRPRRADLLFTGVSLGMTFLTRPQLWPAIVILTGATVLAVFVGYRRLAKHALFLRQTWRVGHWVDFAWVQIPLVMAVALAALANRARSGSVFGVPGELLPQVSSSTAADTALFLLAPGRGLLWLAPLVLLAPLGFAHGMRRGARLWPLCAILASLPVFLAAHTPLSAGEPWGFGPGRLLPAMPLLWLGVALGLDRASRSDGLRRLGYGLCLLGLITNLSGVLVGTGTYQELVAKWKSSPAPEASDMGESSGELYRLAHWTPGLAQPWASWRILRHRLARKNEAFPVEHIFLTAGDRQLSPERARNRGFRHMAWIDLQERLHTHPYPSALFSLLLVAAGCVFAVRGLDRALP